MIGQVPATRWVVLLVDNEKPVRSAVRRSLRGLDAVIHEAESAEEALDWIRAGGRPALVVSDNQMGDMSGLEFLEEVRRLVPGASRILHTADAAVEVSPGSALTVVGKAMHPGHLRSLVEALLGNAGLDGLRQLEGLDQQGGELEAGADPQLL